MSDGPLLDRERIEQAFRLLGDKLAARGVVADIYVFGGAAMVLAYDAQRATRDIGAIFQPHGMVLDEARHVADALGLPPWWLNEQASIYVSGKIDPGKRNVFDHPGLRVAAASPEHMLAMKVLSGRPEMRKISVSCSSISISQPPKTPSPSAAASSPTRYLPEAGCSSKTSSAPDRRSVRGRLLRPETTRLTTALTTTFPSRGSHGHTSTISDLGWGAMSRVMSRLKSGRSAVRPRPYPPPLTCRNSPETAHLGAFF